MARVLLALVLLAAVAAALAWPRLNDVETGHTPEYVDLTPREYTQAEPAVTQAARAAVEKLPRWTFIGAGKGPRGSEVQAVAATALRLKHDVTIRVRGEHGRTRVSVRSRSQTGPWDFGQNARNIRTFLDQLDLELKTLR